MSERTYELKCTVAEAVGYLKRLYETAPNGEQRIRRALIRRPLPSYSRVQKVHALACSAFDQFPEPGTSNPLWDIVRWQPAQDDDCWCTKQPKVGDSLIDLDEVASRMVYDFGINRYSLCPTFSYSVISPGDVAWIKSLVAGREVVELGAGRGYWAWQLRQTGLTVHAYDPGTPGEDNDYFKTPGQFTRVLCRDHLAVDDHPDAALLMVWPGYGADWAWDALRRYRGDLVIYAGEEQYGCTADDDFYELLTKDWEWLATSDKHVTWWGIHCRLTAYVRKQRVVDAPEKRLAIEAW